MAIKKYISAIIVALSALVVTAGLVLAPALASAQTTPAPQGTSAWGDNSGGPGGYGHFGAGMPGGSGNRMGMQPGIFGTVTAINGTTLTVSGKQGRSFGPGPASSTSAQSAPATPAMPATVVYTVDASNSTVRKNNATSTLASIAVGDTVFVRGTVSGTSVTATAIIDGVMPMMMRGGNGGHSGPGMGMMGMGGMGSSTHSMPMSPITGNGQPVIAGSVSAINGNTLTVTNKSNVTYTVDVTNAKIVQGQTTVTVSNIAVGDNVIVQGAVSGTSVTASSVIDQKANVNNGQSPSGAGTNGGGGTNGTPPAPRGGIFGAIGSFFSHIFGF